MPAPSDQTPILALPYILPAQAQKHVSHNEALRLLDMLVQLAVQDRTRISPPEHPTLGDRHIVAAGAGGDWAGQDHHLAVFEPHGWSFLAPQTGWIALDQSDLQMLVFDGTLWRAPELQTLPRLGINASADATNRLSLSAPATLLSHEGAGHQVKINKAGPEETASLLMQSNWQGRAEIGLVGNEDLSLKTSEDGTSWHVAQRIDAGSGIVSQPQTPAFKAYLSADLPLTPGIWAPLTGFTEMFDRGDTLAESTGIFTAPVAGLYVFTLVWRFKATGPLPSQIRAGIGVNGTSPSGPDQMTQGDATLVSQETAVKTSVLLELDTGDEVRPYALTAGNGGAAEALFSAFHGYKLA
jgi:hypothetical protein